MDELLLYGFEPKTSQEKTVAEYRETFVERALQLVGTKSIHYSGPDKGISPEEGFDCSGFVTYLLDKIGFPRDPKIRHCNEYFDSFGAAVHDDLQKTGDLVFFSRNGMLPTHMGIMVDENSFIYAPGKDNTVVKVSPIERTILEVRLDPYQLYRQDPIGFKRLAMQQGRWKKLF